MAKVQTFDIDTILHIHRLFWYLENIKKIGGQQTVKNTPFFNVFPWVSQENKS